MTNTDDALADYSDWNRQLQRLVDDHFLEVHKRVPETYRLHFHSLKQVFSRHWRHKQDIPRDLMALPRASLRLLKRALGKNGHSDAPLGAKEQELANILATELLNIPELESKIFHHLRDHPSLVNGQWDELQMQLEKLTPEDARRRIDDALVKLAITQEGSRDAVVFLTLGIIGRGLSDKIAFGSAIGVGATAAGSVYLGQQSFFGALWASWFGLPAWVGLSGALAGLMIVALATPMLSPFIELGLNRIRSEKHLHKIVDNVQHKIERKGPDAETLVGYMGTYVQMIPDIIVALKSFKS